ncbi:TorF family putative porin [Salinisphaera sp. P385]|uniref:TorF family putative porin n=1 Tax=Spectribacter acetivorans TaxID=3075603 RepID=A0ABU3B799_9GAMM|nr:TorF family putative porin [Salinisphaera sp. P385]MDT0618340.1 TorF family putative porin [Salinisphaera sp. P385]
MKSFKYLAVAGLVGSSALVSAPAMAGMSGNAGVMSQYLFRGLEQSDSPSVYGGLDYAADSGFYVGTWAATVDFAGTPDGDGGTTGAEVDFYAGFAGGDQVTYDVGIIYYWYSEEDEATGDSDPTNNTIEVYGALGFGQFGISGYYAPDTYFAAVNPDGSDAEGAYGVYLTFSQPLTDKLSFDAAVGMHKGEGNESYGGDDSGYMEYNLGLSAALDNGFGMSFGLVMTDRDTFGMNGNDDDPKLVVDASYGFDL